MIEKDPGEVLVRGWIVGRDLHAPRECVQSAGKVTLRTGQSSDRRIELPASGQRHREDGLVLAPRIRHSVECVVDASEPPAGDGRFRPRVENGQQHPLGVLTGVPAWTSRPAVTRRVRSSVVVAAARRSDEIAPA